jgi:hypothetical protein
MMAGAAALDSILDEKKGGEERSYETQIDIYRRHFDGHGLGTAGKHDGPGKPGNAIFKPTKIST